VPWIVPFLPDFTQGGHAPSTATVGSYEQRIKVPLPPPQRVLDLDNDVRVPGDARNPTNALHERPPALSWTDGAVFCQKPLRWNTFCPHDRGMIQGPFWCMVISMMPETTGRTGRTREVRELICSGHVLAFGARDTGEGEEGIQ
jgi:hypothetical protein